MSTALFDRATALGLDDIKVAGTRQYRELRKCHGWTIANAVDGARHLILAEREGWEMGWSDDWQHRHVEEFPDAYDREPDSCEVACLVNADGDILSCLGCCDDFRETDRREVEVDLIAEYLSR